MSVKYSRLPTSDWADPELGSVFNFGSAFTYDQNMRSKYKSAFTYSNQEPVELAQITGFEKGQASFLFRLGHACIIVLCFLIWLVTFPISVWFSFKSVPNFEKIVVFRLGRLQGSKGPGMVFVLPLIDRWHRVDVRIRAFNVPPKQVLTADSAVLEVGADVFYRICDAEKSITHVQNLDQSTRVLVQTCLVNMLVQRNLADIETQRMEISNTVQQETCTAAMAWGVEISRIEMSQIKVLKGPIAKPPPHVFMPPGMFGSAGASSGEDCNPAIPEALQQLASVFLAAQGHNQAAGVSGPAGPSPDLLMAVAEEAQAVGGSEGLGGPTLTPEEILQAVQVVINETLVNKIAAVYQFQLTGHGGGVYFMDLKHGKGSAGAGIPPLGEADATLLMSLPDLQAMFAGKLKPFQAYMNGRLRVSGDLAAAMRLEEVVKRIVGK